MDICPEKKDRLISGKPALPAFFVYTYLSLYDRPICYILLMNYFITMGKFTDCDENYILEEKNEREKNFKLS